MSLLKKLLLLFAAGALEAFRRILSPRASREGSADDDGGKFFTWPFLKKWALRFAVFMIVSSAVGFLVAASGVIPIKASSGHWEITKWFLDFSKRRSVSFHTIGIEQPPIEDAGLVLKGAGHYEIGCAACHGSPKLQTPRIAQAMTPTPPYLPERMGRWEGPELFYIVKHGIKFTGMPAWPAQQRDDEVWAMVAFLQRLPNMEAEEYRKLIGESEASAIEGDADPLTGLLVPDRVPRAVRENCARCHGSNGAGRGAGAFPILAGQRPEYLYASLQAYARGERHSGIMEPVSAGLTDEGMRELADYYANLPATQTSAHAIAESDAQTFALGESIAHQGVPSQRLPACASCHLQTTATRNPVYPEISGQYADYLALQLRLFREGKRGGTPYSHIMKHVASQLTPEQVRAVSLYFSKQAPASKAAGAR